jgi:hypothetical protein
VRVSRANQPFENAIGESGITSGGLQRALVIAPMDKFMGRSAIIRACEHPEAVGQDCGWDQPSQTRSRFKKPRPAFARRGVSLPIEDEETGLTHFVIESEAGQSVAVICGLERRAAVPLAKMNSLKVIPLQIRAGSGGQAADCLYFHKVFQTEQPRFAAIA